jgi:hypothetical protein
MVRRAVRDSTVSHILAERIVRAYYVSGSLVLAEHSFGVPSGIIAPDGV